MINGQSVHCFLSKRNHSQITLYLTLTFSKIDSHVKISGSNSFHQKGLRKKKKTFTFWPRGTFLTEGI